MFSNCIIRAVCQKKTTKNKKKKQKKKENKKGINKYISIGTNSTYHKPLSEDWMERRS